MGGLGFLSKCRISSSGSPCHAAFSSLPPLGLSPRVESQVSFRAGEVKPPELASWGTRGKMGHSAAETEVHRWRSWAV